MIEVAAYGVLWWVCNGCGKRYPRLGNGDKSPAPMKSYRPPDLKTELGALRNEEVFERGVE